MIGGGGAEAISVWWVTEVSTETDTSTGSEVLPQAPAVSAAVTATALANDKGGGRRLWGRLIRDVLSDTPPRAPKNAALLSITIAAVMAAQDWREVYAMVTLRL
ncbi:MAG TPA: hypothetical protein VHO06_11840 [Polyangia bacterium]|nr:hypothetical protein [Polyangia bacterium]